MKYYTVVNEVEALQCEYQCVLWVGVCLSGGCDDNAAIKERSLSRETEHAHQEGRQKAVIDFTGVPRIKRKLRNTKGVGKSKFLLQCSTVLKELPRLVYEQKIGCFRFRQLDIYWECKKSWLSIAKKMLALVLWNAVMFRSKGWIQSMSCSLDEGGYILPSGEEMSSVLEIWLSCSAVVSVSVQGYFWYHFIMLK